MPITNGLMDFFCLSRLPLFIQFVGLTLLKKSVIASLCYKYQLVIILGNVYRSIRNNTERRKLGYLSCGTGNPIDDCWRCDQNWQRHRKRLAECAIGFGHSTVGGRDGKYYIVTNPHDDDAVNPQPGPCDTRSSKTNR
ncbi:putative pectate lyase [Helianthus debilis subsp. tardiflorus]